MYEHIAFDVDGTLIDTQEATILALLKVLKEETGKDFDFEELKFVIGIPGEVSLPRLGIKNIDYVNRKWSAYLRHFTHHIKVYPGIRDMFMHLSDLGIKTGLVTSNTRYELEELLNNFIPFKLKEYTQHIICADNTERHKPYPEPLLKYLEVSGVNRAKVLYIGDTIYDMRCAEAAKIDFALALWGNNSEKGIRAKFVFHSTDELYKLFDVSRNEENANSFV